MFKYIVLYVEKGFLDIFRDPIIKVEFNNKKEAKHFILKNYESNHIRVCNYIFREWNLDYFKKIKNFINNLFK